MWPFDFGGSGLDLASFTAHKLGGPYGVGALLARREVGLTAVLHGGGQERDVRSGTLDVAAVAGFAAAVAVATRRRAAGGGPAPGPAGRAASPRCSRSSRTPCRTEPPSPAAACPG